MESNLGGLEMANWNERFRIRDVYNVADNLGAQVSMALVSDHRGELRCIGTGFLVAPGLAITAWHVAEDWKTHLSRLHHIKCPENEFSVFAVQLYRDTFLTWRVDAIYGSPSSDIAFLRFQQPSWWGQGPDQVKPPIARLNFSPPKIGDELKVFGFPESRIEDGILVVSPSECDCRVLRVDMSTGVSYRPFSHIDVEGEIIGGMSGGPCFDKDGNVVGVNSRGWDGLQLAHVALLWPAMSTKIDLFKTGLFPVVDLFQKGPLEALGSQRLYVASTGNAHLAKIDLDSTLPLPHLGPTESIAVGLNFAVSNAEKALIKIRSLFCDFQTSDINELFGYIRNYFWELETALNLALLLVSRRIGLSLQEPMQWEALLPAWQSSVDDPKVLDELAMLNFDWNSISIFEVRKYAELCRTGVLSIYSILPSRNEAGTGPAFRECLNFLSQCRKHGNKIPLPDHLDFYMDASRRFVYRLLSLAPAKI